MTSMQVRVLEYWQHSLLSAENGSGWRRNSEFEVDLIGCDEQPILHSTTSPTEGK